MRRHNVAVLIVVVLAVTLACATGSYAIPGFAFSISERVHQENGSINGTVTAVYPDGLTFSWEIGDEPELVYDPGMRLDLEFTVLGASNWKEAWVKTRNGNTQVSLKGIDPNPGSVLTCELNAEALVSDHLNSISMVVKDRGSNIHILWIKSGIDNWRSSIIRVKMITPLFDKKCWTPICYKGVTVTAQQVFLLSHNGGIPSVGSVDLDLLKQLIERQLSDPRQPIIEDPTRVSQAPTPAATTPPASTGPTITLADLPLTGSKHYECNLPIGTHVQYSLTMRGAEPKWVDATLTSAHLRLTPPAGEWCFRIRAFSPQGVLGPETTRNFTEGGASQ
jgi:hypothetical protein